MFGEFSFQVFLQKPNNLILSAQFVTFQKNPV